MPLVAYDEPPEVPRATQTGVLFSTSADSGAVDGYRGVLGRVRPRRWGAIIQGTQARQLHADTTSFAVSGAYEPGEGDLDAIKAAISWSCSFRTAC